MGKIRKACREIRNAITGLKWASEAVRIALTGGKKDIIKNCLQFQKALLKNGLTFDVLKREKKVYLKVMKKSVDS